jgi:hypothetical protein
MGRKGRSTKEKSETKYRAEGDLNNKRKIGRGIKGRRHVTSCQ